MDINRSGTGLELIRRVPELQAHHRQIQISEKLNVIKQLGVRLEHINTVEIEQIKLQIATLNKEVEMLKSEQASTVVDADIIS